MASNNMNSNKNNTNEDMKADIRIVRTVRVEGPNKDNNQTKTIITTNRSGILPNGIRNFYQVRTQVESVRSSFIPLSSNIDSTRKTTSAAPASTTTETSSRNASSNRNAATFSLQFSRSPLFSGMRFGATVPEPSTDPNTRRSAPINIPLRHDRRSHHNANRIFANFPEILWDVPIDILMSKQFGEDNDKPE